MKTSIFEIFKIGVGPSSSHTVGPMRAARRFALDLEERGLLERVARVRVELFGSLALTGHGHATDRAVLLGLSGEAPDTIDPATIDERVGDIRQRQELKLLGAVTIPFQEGTDLLFLKTQTLPGHSNGMRYTAFGGEGAELYSAIFYSVGGGFIRREGEATGGTELKAPPFPFTSADELLAIGEREKLAIWEIVLQNEKTWRDEAHIRSGVAKLWEVMQACVQRGLATEGILPGGLNVRRRAPRLAAKLSDAEKVDPLAAMDWVNV
ncbi:MAG TPA: serine dehydratase beta chain, partial [Candidatus Angelobacter sp.]|nr:serine dehydratase beta chain [Candidatus Angelobacter sp.]